MSLSFVEPLRSSSRSRKLGVRGSSSRSRSRGPSAVRSPSRSAMRSPSAPRRRSSAGSDTPQKFQKRVGFDTFDNKDATDFSLTLQAKHADYTYTRLSRTFLCGTDQNDYSDYALEWLLDELVDDGDEVVCLRVVDPNAKISSSDSSLQEKVYRDEAYKLLNDIMDKNDEDKKISLILEFAVGKVQDMIQRMIEIYEPAVLIVGTRGKSLNGFQGLLPGSISKYCLQHSPVPVIVVRPSGKREKKKLKRQADPSRRTYMDIVENSKSVSTRTLTDSGHETTANKVEPTPSASSSSSNIASAATSVTDLSKLEKVHSVPDSSSTSLASSLGHMSLHHHHHHQQSQQSPADSPRETGFAAADAARAALAAAKKSSVTDSTAAAPAEAATSAAPAAPPEIVIDDAEDEKTPSQETSDPLNKRPQNDDDDTGR